MMGQIIVPTLGPYLISSLADFYKLISELFFDILKKKKVLFQPGDLNCLFVSGAMVFILNLDKVLLKKLFPTMNI